MSRREVSSVLDGARITWWRPVLVVIVMIPFLVALSYVHRTGQSVPFWDEWEWSAPIAIGSFDGTLRPADLFRQHNEHRLVFSGLVTAALARAGDWDPHVEMYISLAIALLTWLLLLDLLRQGGGEGAKWAAIALSALAFWPGQYFNWVVGFQTQIYFFMLFSVAAIWVLARSAPTWSAMLVAAVAVNCAQLSQGGGVAVWPALLVGMWMLGYSRRQLCAAAAIAAVSITAFFQNYIFFSSPDLNLLGAIRFALAYLGSLFVLGHSENSVWMAVVFAILGMLLFLGNLWMLVVRHRSWSAAAPWVMLMLVALGTAVLVGRGRHMYGGPYALNSRYVTQASLYWLAICGLCSVSMRAVLTDGVPIARRRIVVFCGAAFMALVVVLYFPTASRRLSWHLVSEETALCLKRYPSTADFSCLRGTHSVFDEDFADEQHRARVLDLITATANHRFGVFADGATQGVP